MKFCPKCGMPVESYGPSGWNSGLRLYGCPQCNILWEEHGDCLSGMTTELKEGFHSLSKWKQYEKEGMAREREAQQKKVKV